MKKLKLCFAASTGGHFEQLMALAPLMERHDSFIVTEKTDYKPAVVNRKTYYLRQVNRRQRTLVPVMLWNALLSLRILIRERPDAVICTGVLAMIPLCLLAKLFGKKLVYIESFAKVSTPTESGKLLYRFADRFYVQWESMLDVYPDAVYAGSVY